MNKSDLKTGMWVETKEKLWMIVVDDGKPYMFTPNNWMPVEDFPRAYKGDCLWDILNVYDYFSEDYDNKIGSLQYDEFKDRVKDPTCLYFKKIWEAPKKETIKIGEVTYDKSEFEQAVKNLKPINK